jgi:hypothetical protein
MTVRLKSEMNFSCASDDALTPHLASPSRGEELYINGFPSPLMGEG